MAINLATTYSSKVDEVMKKGALTTGAVNEDYSFVGAQTVKVYGMGTAAMNDYQASGTNRYGTPTELDDTTQELQLRKKRSFTYTIDATNRVDSPEGVRDAGKSLRRQLDEKVIPEIDTYRICQAAIGAGTIKVSSTSSSTAYSDFLALNGALDNAEVPDTGRIAFCTPTYINSIKQADAYIKASEIGQNIIIKGQVGEIDGVALIKTPESRMPAGASIVITHPVAMPSPTKLSEYKIHENPPGVAGHLIEGLVYYDAFVLDNKKKAIAVHFGVLGTLTAVMTAVASGTGKLSVSGNVGGTLVYKTASSVTAPSLGGDISAWTAFPSDGVITATSGHKVCVAVKADGKAVAISAVIDVVVGS